MKRKTPAKRKASTALGRAYTYHPKVGDRVQFRPWAVIGDKTGPEVPAGFYSHMRHLCGAKATVQSVDGDFITLGEFTVANGVGFAYSRQMVMPAKLTKAERAARDAARRERAAKAAEAAAREATLPESARNVLKLLREDKLAFGCQRSRVIKLAEAIIGVKLSDFLKGG